MSRRYQNTTREAIAAFCRYTRALGSRQKVNNKKTISNVQINCSVYETLTCDLCISFC